MSNGRTPLQRETEHKLMPMAQGIGRGVRNARSRATRNDKDVWHEAPPMALMASTLIFRPLPSLGRRIVAATALLMAMVGVSATIIVAVVGSG